ncbi:MAG: hypothetical protein ABIS14_14830 [Sphingomonas sp.]
MGLAVFLPVGRTVDPDTGRDWEGDGIRPILSWRLRWRLKWRYSTRAYPYDPLGERNTQ